MNHPLNHPLCWQQPTDLRTQRAMTLIELSLVLALIMGLVSSLLIGMSAYKRGADRANCVLNMATLQKAVRSYSNIHEAFPGSPVTDLKSKIIGPGKFLPSAPECPGTGTYHFYGDGTDGSESSVIPNIGTNYLRCSITEHIPKSLVGW